MLDLAFLILMIIALVKAIKGDYNELLCNISMVIGIIAALIGMVSSFLSNAGDSMGIGIMNILVFLISIALKPVAKHFAQLYQNKIDEQVRIYSEEIERAQTNFNRPVIRDNTYINNPAEQQPASSQENSTANFVHHASGFPQVDNCAFQENQNIAAASNTVLIQKDNTTTDFAVPNKTVPPQNVNATENLEMVDNIVLPIKLNEPIDLRTENNFGLPYDLNAPIDLDKPIDDISPNNK